MSPRRSERGFTVLELAITMLLLSVALAIAGGLLVEAVRVFSATGRELREPASELTFRLLRDDVRAASPHFPGLAPEDLELVRADGTSIWTLSGERLERRSFDAEGNDLGTRPMLDKVLSFHWMVLAGKPGLIQVTIVRRRPENASALRAATSLWRDHGEIFESATIVVGSRIKPVVPE